MVESNHHLLTTQIKDPSNPKTFYRAIKDPDWATAVNTERSKFELNCRMGCITWCRWHSGRSSAAGRALSQIKNIVRRQFCRPCLIRLLTGKRKQQSYSARIHVDNIAVEKIMKWCHFSLRRPTEGIGLPVGCWISNYLFLNSGILDLSEITLQCISLRNGYYTYILYPYTKSMNYNRMTMVVQSNLETREMCWNNRQIELYMLGDYPT